MGRACRSSPSLNLLNWNLKDKKLDKWRRRNRMGEKVKGIRSRNGRYKIDRGRLRIVWEM